MITTEIVKAEQVLEGMTPVVADVVGKAMALANITDHQSFANADSFLSEIKRVQKRLDDERKKFTIPIDLAKSQITAAFRPKLKMIADAEMILKGATRKWFIAEQERKREEEQKRRAEDRKRQEDENLRRAADLEKHGNKVHAEAVLNEPIVDTKPKVQTSFDGAHSYGRKVWKTRITDMPAFLNGIRDRVIPDTFIEINQKEMNRYATMWKGKKSWPGVLVSEDVVMGVRR